MVLDKKLGKVPDMMADPKLLRIVFQNLLSNAIKYTPIKGKVGINVSFKKRGTKLGTRVLKKNSICIQVSDTGYGIPKNQQDKIFTKLFRADNVREKETEGTGLGLYIIKAIVDNAEGYIWFKSQENKGTTFFICLPLKGMKAKEGAKDLSYTG